ncbi:hypothetical protein ACTFIR_002729 [Dictyostelium discoideum]
MPINSKFSINDVLLNQETLQKKNKYTCPICFEFIYKKSIYQCRSGHVACQECWDKSLKNKKECMICKSEVNSFKDLSRCLVIEQGFGKKECYCIYSFTNDYFIDCGANQENEKRKLIKDEENGCKEIINVDKIENHFENCKYYEYGCKVEMKRPELQNHLNNVN